MVIKCNFVTSFLNNVGSLWPTMLPPFAQGLMLMVLSFKCVNIPLKDRCCFQVNVSFHLSGKGLTV